MKRSLSRLPISRSRASSTSRASSSTQPNTPSFTRSKSSLSLRRTPQSVQSSRTKIRTKKKDVRPIQDKKWQVSALEQTQHYFQQCPEGSQFLNKGISIRPITLKMFVQLANCVLQNIDACFDELTLSNYTELLPIHLDTLMYPGTVTASTLKTANTMHSWPHILGILSWLVDLHELSMMVNMDEVLLDIAPNASIEEQINKSQTKIIFDFFQQFNKGEGIYGSEDLMIIENMYKKICNYSEEEFENTTKIKNKFQEEHQNLEKVLSNDQEAISALEDECNIAENKLKCIRESNETEKLRKIDVNAKKVEFMNEIKNFRKTHVNIENSIEVLKEKIKSQPMNLIQRANEEKKFEDLKREIAFMNEKKRHQVNLRDEGDMKLSEVKQKIEQVVHNYNIELLRPSVQHPELKQIALRQDKLLQPNMKEFTKETTKLKQQLLNDLDMKIQADNDALARLKLTRENAQQNIKTIKRQVQVENKKQEVLTQEHESVLKIQEQAEKQKEVELSELKQKLLKLKEANPNVEQKLKQLKEAKTNCNVLKSKLYSESADIEKFFEKIEEEIRTKQVPRYEKIAKTIIVKVDKAVEQYSSLP